ncbi:hypothetical protein B0A48_06143 [Cryoendolithus antarcticus]|uniref:Uncharacterized protein n=1 Tax=Cryoendolithus antarcticus TaxID=1507870 RepID=A0A1V8TA42_9PEZI|nr:hypothetical protein B0A48_06143 [Cryoendolithus antarcticus]
MKYEIGSEASLSPVSTSSPASSTSPLPDISTIVFDSERHSAVEPMPRELAKARILMHLELANQPNHLKASDDAYTRADVPELFDHFIDTAEAWAGSSECQRLLQTWSPSLSVMHTFLLHGMLAFSASHLQSLRPWEKKYGLAAALHCGLSLQGFSATLSQRVDHDNADALFACCYLHTMLALYNKSRSDQTSMIDNDFAWLRGMKGIPILQRTNVLRPHLNHSIWLPVFVETKAYSAEIGHLPTPKNEHSAVFPEIEILRAQCQVNRLDPDNDENPYAIPLAHLDRLSRLSSIGNSQIGMLMVFIGRMPECFVALLERLDPLAMRILALWCDYAGQVKQWWCMGLECQSREEFKQSKHLDHGADALHYDGYASGSATQASDSDTGASELHDALEFSDIDIDDDSLDDASVGVEAPDCGSDEDLTKSAGSTRAKKSTKIGCGGRVLSDKTLAWLKANTPWLTPKTDCEYEQVLLEAHDPPAFKVINAPGKGLRLKCPDPREEYEEPSRKHARFFAGCAKIHSCHRDGGDELVTVPSSRPVDVQKFLAFSKYRMDPKVIEFLDSKTFRTADLEELKSFTARDLKGWGVYGGWIVYEECTASCVPPIYFGDIDDLCETQSELEAYMNLGCSADCKRGRIEGYIGSSVAGKGMGERVVRTYERGLQYADAGVFDSVLMASGFAPHAVTALAKGARLIMRPLLTFDKPRGGRDDALNRSTTADLHVLESMFIDYCQGLKASTDQEIMDVPTVTPVSREALSQHCRSVAPSGHDVSDHVGLNGMLPVLANYATAKGASRPTKIAEALECQDSTCPLCLEPLDPDTQTLHLIQGGQYTAVIEDHQLVHKPCIQYLREKLQVLNDTPGDLRLLDGPLMVLAAVREMQKATKTFQANREVHACGKRCPLCDREYVALLPKVRGTGRRQRDNLTPVTAPKEAALIPCLQGVQVFCLKCVRQITGIITKPGRPGFGADQRCRRAQEADCSLEKLKGLFTLQRGVKAGDGKSLVTLGI